MPITQQDALEIAKYGKFYRQDTNRSGIPTRNVFCDYCSRSGLTGSWKLNNEIDLCNNCYIILQKHISLNNTKFSPPNNNLDNRSFSPYDAMKIRQNERFDFTESTNNTQQFTINGVPFTHNFPSVNTQTDSLHNMTNERIINTNNPNSDYASMFSMPLEN
jgi:hypothetical protein